MRYKPYNKKEVESLLLIGRQLLKKVYTTPYGRNQSCTYPLVQLIGELKKYHWAYTGGAVHCLEIELLKLQRRFDIRPVRRYAKL